MMRRVEFTTPCEGSFERRNGPRRYYEAGVPIETELTDDELPPYARVVDGGSEASRPVGIVAVQSLADAVSSDVRVERACLALDPDDDKHWTENGLPAMEAVNRLAGPGPQLVRQDVHAWDQSFRRPERD